MPQYHPVSTVPGDGTHVPLNDNSILMTSSDAKGHNGLGAQKYDSIIIRLPPCLNFFFNSNSLYGPPIILSYDRGSSSYSGVPSTLYTNQSVSSLPRAQQIHQDPQGRVSTHSTMTDMPPMYCRNPTSDDSAPVSSSSSIGNTNEKSGSFP